MLNPVHRAGANELIERYLGTAYDNVKTVAESIMSINLLGNLGSDALNTLGSLNHNALNEIAENMDKINLVAEIAAVERDYGTITEIVQISYDYGSIV